MEPNIDEDEAMGEFSSDKPFYIQKLEEVSCVTAVSLTLRLKVSSGIIGIKIKCLNIID